MVPKFESIIHHDTKSSVQHPDMKMIIEICWKNNFWNHGSKKSKHADYTKKASHTGKHHYFRYPITSFSSVRIPGIIAPYGS